LVTLTQEIAALHGVALLDFVLADFAELRRSLFDPQGLMVSPAAAHAPRQLEQRLGEWLGQTGLVDALTQSVPHNVTAEMGLALLDVADAIRPHPEVVACLEAAQDDGFLHRLPALPGGPAAREVIEAFLHTYGARCVGEIDIARPRWSERPATLLPLVLANVRNFGPGEGARRLQRGRVLAAVTETAILARLRDLTGGEQEAQEVRALIERLRTFTGYREYPKYGMVRRYAVYKRALLEEADRLVASGVLADREEIFLLRLPELRDVVQTGHADRELIQGRREALHADRVRVPPRVFTSDGEVIAGEYRRDDVPDGALAGLAVSAGVVEGRARVVREIADADLEAGDILITPYTDPSWTPVFLTIAGLVTEVGGLMTHGAVIAREYGLPAVVGVRDATRLIADGRRIRLDAAAGWVQLLD
jgi:phosphoenolpyruvate synthase/pyruvate phosphate dikinase